MPRIRTIKPQFWIDEKLGELPRDARLLYIGLWNLSDDQGVFEWRPARIKAQLFPYDQDISGKDIGEWLDKLETAGKIKKFQFENKPFGCVIRFLVHQDIKNPSKWTFAPIPSDCTPALPKPYPSKGVALPVGNRGVGGREVGNRKKGLGNNPPVVPPWKGGRRDRRRKKVKEDDPNRFYGGKYDHMIARNGDDLARLHPDKYNADGTRKEETK